MNNFICDFNRQFQSERRGGARDDRCRQTDHLRISSQLRKFLHSIGIVRVAACRWKGKERTNLVHSRSSRLDWQSHHFALLHLQQEETTSPSARETAGLQHCSLDLQLVAGVVVVVAAVVAAATPDALCNLITNRWPSGASGRMTAASDCELCVYVCALCVCVSYW